MNSMTTEDMAERFQLSGQDWLLYKSYPMNIAMLRGPIADPDGIDTQLPNIYIKPNSFHLWPLWVGI